MILRRSVIADDLERLVHLRKAILWKASNSKIE